VGEVLKEFIVPGVVGVEWRIQASSAEEAVAIATEQAPMEAYLYTGEVFEIGAAREIKDTTQEGGPFR
jgi:hypothetical protein